MDVSEPPDPEHPLKRKRSQEREDERSKSNNLQDGNTPVNGGPLAPADTNGAKRLRRGDRNGRMEAYGPVKIPRDISNLPGEIWLYIFGFLPPPTLSQLLAVNHRFKELLSQESSEVTDEPSIGGYFNSHDSNFLWSASRRLCFPTMPRPLSSHSELDMWKLISGHNCQFCGKKGPSKLPSITSQPWTSGPGLDGVRIIWPFGVRSCGECLSSRMKKEMDVMFSSSIPSALLPALAFGFFTSSLDYISPVTLRANSHSSNISMSKYYFQPHLDEIKAKFEEVRALGGATAEEWFKGLEGTGKDRLADALRWEQWDVEGGLEKVHSFYVPKPPPPPSLSIPAPTQASTKQAEPEPPAPLHIFPPAPQIGPPPPGQPYPFPHPPSASSVAAIGPFAPGVAPGTTPYGVAPVPPPPGVPVPFAHLPPKPMTPMVPMSPTPQYNPFQQQQQQQQQQQPPPPPPALAAPLQAPPQPRPLPMQIPIQPHTPQVRAERSIKDVNEAKAQRRADIERRCMELDPPIKPSILIHMESFAAAIQIPMAMNDGAWEHLKPRLLAQREVAEAREKQQLEQSRLLQARTEERRQQEAQLQAAKESLDRQWEESQQPLRNKLNHYADEILQLQWSNGQAVTKENCAQFAADVLIYVRTRFYQIQEYEDNVALAAGRPIRIDGSTDARKLTLENMKWVYDNKVKPFTEPLAKEIFFCSGCENSTKAYGFEGVIQHYAAKHTSLLSMGSVVVHWKADWPEDPPFDSTPARLPINSVSTSPQYPSTVQLGNQSQPYSQYSPISTASTYQQPQQAPLSASATTYPGLSQQPSYGTPQQPTAQYNPWSATSHSPAEARPPSYQYNTAQSPWPPAPQPAQQPARPSFAPHLGAPGQPFGIYQVQLEELSRYAREIFEGTSGVKDFPSSVRIHAIIHHVVLRFKDRFTNEPNLALFTDALNNISQMKPLRTLSDLVCKTCSIQRMADSVSGDQAEELHTLPTLLSHFQTAHIEQAKPAMVSQTGIEPPRVDWKFDMVKLPSNAETAKLIDAPGMTDSKLSIVATVLTDVFPSPLPKIGNREPYIEPSEVPSSQSNGQPPQLPTASAAPVPTPPAPERVEVVVDNFPKFVESPIHYASQAAEPAREDEYDPHRPAYIEPIPGSYTRFHHSKHPSKDASHRSSPYIPPRAQEQTISAAEQFLNSFDPSDERDTYEPPEYVRSVSIPPSQAGRQHTPLSASLRTPNHNQLREPPSYRPSSSWSQRPYEVGHDSRVADLGNGMRVAPQPTGPDYGRYPPAPNEGVYYVGHESKRSTSQFNDYDSRHQGSLRSRSRSPGAPNTVPPERGYYRARSPIQEPAPMYGGQHVIREREYYPPPERVQYMPEPPRQQYVERGYNGHPYDNTVEYIRVPAPPPHEPQPYYVERQPPPPPPPPPRPPPAGHYVPYEEPVYEHGGQLYRRSQIPPDATTQRHYYH